LKDDLANGEKGSTATSSGGAKEIEIWGMGEERISIEKKNERNGRPAPIKFATSAGE
jgi:hypothetical protein